MSWQRYKRTFGETGADESHFILGLDLGNAASSIAYFDVNRRCSDVIDISGGYGKPQTPTVMQYIPENREWVFGEYALLNRDFGRQITLSHFMERLGHNEYFDVDNSPYNLPQLLGLYLKNLLGYCKNLNPKAQIAGLCLSGHSYLSDFAKEELRQAVRQAGFDKSLIAFVDDRECVFQYFNSLDNLSDGKYLVLDFGHRALRGGLYRIKNRHNLSVECLSNLFSENLGTKQVDERILRLITRLYCEKTGLTEKRLQKNVSEELSAFTFLHKDVIFQRSVYSKPLRLYYNFAYPPFEAAITPAHLDAIVNPLSDELKSFLSDTLNKSTEATNPGEVIKVICTGGGAEMFWVSDVLKSIFGQSQTILGKNPKAIMAQGAALVAAGYLGIVETPVFNLTDTHRLSLDIGVCVKEGGGRRFVPIVERNAFWWQNHPPKSFIIDEETGHDIDIELYTRDGRGDLNMVKPLILRGLPPRPKGVTRISIGLEFINPTSLRALVRDVGFGELFPGGDYSMEYPISI